MRDAPRTEVTGATDRPMQATDPTISEGLNTVSATVSTVNGTELEGAMTSPSEILESSDLLDVEDPTGTDMKVDLEATHASSDDIVIADDLAEDAPDDTDEHTETGGTVPPFRTNN